MIGSFTLEQVIVGLSIDGQSIAMLDAYLRCDDSDKRSSS